MFRNMIRIFSHFFSNFEQSYLHAAIEEKTEILIHRAQINATYLKLSILV